ncbi:HK97 family phage prohead protease [Ovoidimarina sediminis]|uniref:HK97 family phage prohead protease n=1 Tax=Ovoidimarina sediminis TaxID=3079856 RepID=UPI00290802D2|nr:HK97 family phage prohead protease [Rhodophyticola sp. MJ-SS7]MDU8946111.1 HK97 family phage prohead protease [Rhodophyticola sp. MJ-SS7]
MLWGASLGALELRTEGGSARLRATFPYGAETELAPGRREVVASRAFADRIERGEDVHFLSGHNFEKPLASRAAGSLTIRDTDHAVEIEATIDGGTTWARDFMAAHDAGLIRGLSPGFRVLPQGERVERRADGMVRTITQAALYEFSAVTKPAYPAAQIEARSWIEAPDAQLQLALTRWRA